MEISVSTAKSEEEILQILASIIHEALRVPLAEIVPDARLMTNLGAESIDILDIRFRIEESFGFKIQEGEIIKSIDPNLTLEELKDRFTVGSIVEFIRQKLSVDV